MKSGYRLFFTILLTAAALLPQAPAPDRLQKQMQAAFDREMARDKAGDCPDAAMTFALNNCLAAELEITRRNYAEFAAAIRGILAARPENGVPSYGPTGKANTPSEILAAFDSAQAAWEKYREALCAGVDTLWRSGTIVHAKDLSCEFTTIRNHVRDLSATYRREY